MPRLYWNRLLVALMPLLLVFASVCHAEDSGLLWQAQSANGRNNYLFGTMHADDARIRNFSPALVKAIATSDVFMVEVLSSSSNEAQFMRGKTLSQLLNADEYAQVAELADAYVIDRQVANRMKPWLLAIMFDQPKPANVFSQDVFLRGIAADHLKPVLALEQSDRHFEVLDSLSMEEQLTMLRVVLKRSQEDKERDFNTLLEAYLSGNLTKIAGLDEELTGGLLPAEIWQKIRVKLLDQRNATMAERIIAQTGKTSAFIAVGASHLAGPDGLLARLRAAGFKLTPLNQ